MGVERRHRCAWMLEFSGAVAEGRTRQTNHGTETSIPKLFCMKDEWVGRPGCGFHDSHLLMALKAEQGHSCILVVDQAF